MLVIRDYWGNNSIIPLYFQVIDGMTTLPLVFDNHTFSFVSLEETHPVTIERPSDAVIKVMFDCSLYARNYVQFPFELSIIQNLSSRVIEKGTLELQ
jgi:hypothetical protein